MKEIQAYHKASAEALELQVETFGKEGIFYFPETFSPLTRWEPDQDANQMLMVWDLIRSKATTGHIFSQIIAQYYADKDDIKLATMRAFMQYIKTKK